MSEDFTNLIEQSISKLQVKQGSIINATVIDIKKDLGELASSKLSPISLEMNKLMKDEKYLDTIISNGKDRAINIANPVLSKIYEIIGFFSQ